MKRRRIDVLAFDRERIVRRGALVSCPICRAATEMLTIRQSGALVQTGPQSIRRWLARGQAHGGRTTGGQHHVCRKSLFVNPAARVAPAQSKKEELRTPFWG